jgi:hypothetical protein
MRTIEVPEADAFVHVVTTLADMERHVFPWLDSRQGQVNGLDLETNARDPWHAGFFSRTAQFGDETQAFVIVTDPAFADEHLGALASEAIHLHESWVAHFSENDIAFAHRGLPRWSRGDDPFVSPIRLGQETPHVMDSQVVGAMFDPRTVSSRKGIDPRIPRLRGLKPNTELYFGPALRNAEQRLEEWFKEQAPVGHRAGKQLPKTWGFEHADPTHEIYAVYAGLDAIYGLRYFNLCRAHLTNRGQWPRAKAALVEQWMLDQARIPGMQIDAPYALWLQAQFADLLERNAGLLATYGIGEKASGPAVGHAFKSRGIDSPVVKEVRQDDGSVVRKESWDKDALKALSQHENAKVRELAQTISTTRRAGKFKTAYVDPMVNACAFGDGAMHTSVRANGTVTTRMSAQKTPSSGPVQQLPKKDPRVRAAVRSRRGWVLVTADFEQGEPFTMAALTGDLDYLRDLTEPLPELGKPDINSRIAQLVYGDLYDPRQGKANGTVHYLMRQNAKAGWLLCCYGGGAETLEWTLQKDLPSEIKSGVDAQQTLATWHGAYPVFWKAADEYNQVAVLDLDSGHKVPLWDRFGVSADGSLFLRNRPSRKGLNGKTQGTQADLLKLAMHRLNHGGWTWAFRFPLHDELMLEVPWWMAEAARLALEEAMTITYRGVTLRCDAVIEGKTWMQQPTEFSADGLPDELEDED